MKKRKPIEILSVNSIPHIYLRPFEIKFYEGKDKRSFGVAVYDTTAYQVFVRGYYNFNTDTILEEVKQHLILNGYLKNVEISTILNGVEEIIKSFE